jgi:hypothetical protein
MTFLVFARVGSMSIGPLSLGTRPIFVHIKPNHKFFCLLFFFFFFFCSLPNLSFALKSYLYYAGYYVIFWHWHSILFFFQILL